MLALILVLLAVGGVVFFMSRRSASNTKAIQETELDDAIADARHHQVKRNLMMPLRMHGAGLSG